MIYLFFRGVAAALGLVVVVVAFVALFSFVGMMVENAFRRRGLSQSEARMVASLLVMATMTALAGGALAVIVGTP